TAVAKEEKLKLDKGAAALIAIAAGGSFRDALSILQKVMMASLDGTLSGDEVATIIGAPKGQLLIEIVEALGKKEAEPALEAVSKAAGSADMKLFVRLLLERVRAIVLLRNLPSRREDILSDFSEEEAALIERLAGDKASAINSHMLLRLLDTAEQTSRSQIPSLPLEVAIIDLCEAKAG